MNQKEFDAIYPKELNPIQHKVLDLFLQGKSDGAIARSLDIKTASVRPHITNICNLFGFKNEEGKHYRLRNELIPLFAKYKPELVSEQLKATCESSPDNPAQVEFYYVERDCEDQCYDKILEKGALIRIKAPQKMGKTLLVDKILDRASQEGYKTAILSFEEADSEVLGDYRKLLQWLCVTLGDLLELENKLGEYWDDTLGGINPNVTKYLERYLFKDFSQPLVLVLEKVDLVFEQATFNVDFCRLLRGWNDAAKRKDRRSAIWQKIRLIVVHATEVYSSLDINSSPLAGVGLTVSLPDFTLATFQRVVEINEALNDQRSVAIRLNALAGVLQQQDKLDEAAATFQRVVEINEALNDQRSVAIALNALAGVLQQQGKLDEAAATFQRVVEINEALNDRRQVAIGLNGLAGVLQQQGKLHEAVATFQRQVEISQTLNDQRSVAIALNGLAGVLQQQGKLDEAVATFERVVEISQTLNDQRQEAITLHCLSGVLEQQQKWHEAEMVLRHSYDSFQKIGDKRGQVLILNSLGQVLSRQEGNEKFELSLMYFRASIKLGEELEDQTHLAKVYTAMGQALLRHGETEEAVTKLTQSFEIDENLRNSSNLGKVTPHLTEALVKLGKREEALAYCQRALAVAPNSKKLQKLQNKLSSSQRKVLDRRQTLAYSLLLTVSPKIVLVGGELEVAIHLSLSGTNSSNSYLIEVPQDEIVGSDLNIILTASGFQIDGDNAASLPLEPNTDNEVPTPQLTQTCRFRLTALRPGSATITAELYRGDIFQTNIEAKVQVAEFDEAGLLGKRITTQPRPVPQPDFILKVQTALNQTNSTWRFQYQLRSFRLLSLFPGETTYYSESLSSRWIEQMPGLLGTTLENLSDALPEDGRSHLTSLGQYLFQHLLPPELQSDFRALIPRDRTFTLLILADQDASLPWELLHDGQQFLSDRFIIGRWFWELNDSRPHEFPVGAINVAHYADVEQPQLWTALLEPPGASPPLPLPEGVLSNLDSTEAIRGLHLIRYSQSSDAANRRNAPVTLYDTNNEQDIERQMRPAKLNLRRNRPLVSLGYVRRDRPEWTTLEQTWASAFIRAGCSAFTGSLWAVDPAIEAAFISCFYNRLWRGDSLGEAFYTSRQLARAAAPDSLDWLAYVLFGDPMARPYRPVEGKGYAVVEPIGREIDEPLPPGVPIRFRLSLRRTPPVWHEERVIEVAENLTFENLQAHVKTFGLQVTPDSAIAMSLAPTGNYLGWFTLVAPPEMVGNSALVQVFLMDGMQPIHSLMFSLNIEIEGVERGRY